MVDSVGCQFHQKGKLNGTTLTSKQEGANFGRIILIWDRYDKNVTFFADYGHLEKLVRSEILKTGLFRPRPLAFDQRHHAK